MCTVCHVTLFTHGGVNNWHDAVTPGFDNCNSKDEKSARKQGKRKKGLTKAQLKQLAIEEEWPMSKN